MAWATGGAFVVALALSMLAGWLAHPAPLHEAELSRHAWTATSRVPGRLVDSDGVVVPSGNYRRIMSVSGMADEILLGICEPDRIIAFSASSQRGQEAFRYAGKPTVERVEDLEGILSLRPDLVLLNGIGDPRPVARLRESGLVVFDLGETHGLSTLMVEIPALAALLGDAERGERFARDLDEQMQAVGADVPDTARPRGMYLSVYGATLYGSASKTSFHDILLAAGLHDAAAAFTGFPQYTSEQILEMDPDVVVSSEGMRQKLCLHPGLDVLRACKTQGAVVEVGGEVLDHPGPFAILQTARQIRMAVHGPPKKSVQ